MPDELDRQLTAFGRTLGAAAGEPIHAPGTDGGDGAAPLPSRADTSRRRRWWAGLGAAAIIVAAVAGGIVLRSRGDTDHDHLPPIDSNTATSSINVTDTDRSTTSTSSTINPPAVTETAWAFDVPAGAFDVGIDDLFVVHDDGDLWLHPGMLGETVGNPVLVADLDDPRVPVDEGPGPNTVEQVAGVVDGSVIYSDCCEPVAGNVYASTASGAAPTRVSFGSTPALSADGTRLATGALYGLSVIDITTGRSITGELDDTGGFRQALDVTWLGDRLAVLSLTGQVIELLYVDPDTLTVVGEPIVVANFDPMGSNWPSLAGVLDGEVVLTR